MAVESLSKKGEKPKGPPEPKQTTQDKAKEGARLNYSNYTNTVSSKGGHHKVGG